MKINEIICKTSKENRQDVLIKIKKSLNQKIQNLDFDPQNIMKSDYFVHDFFLVKSQLFIIYKHQQYRALLLVNTMNNSLIVIKIYVKKKAHERYYEEFRKYAKTLINQ